MLVSTDLVDVQLSDANRGRGACAIDTADSCSYCGNRIGIPECPEWTQDEGSSPTYQPIPLYPEKLTPSVPLAWYSYQGSSHPIQELGRICRDLHFVLH